MQSYFSQYASNPLPRIFWKIRPILAIFKIKFKVINYLVQLFILEWFVQIRAYTWSIFEGFFLQIRAYTWSELKSVV